MYGHPKIKMSQVWVDKVTSGEEESPSVIDNITTTLESLVYRHPWLLGMLKEEIIHEYPLLLKMMKEKRYGRTKTNTCQQTQNKAEQKANEKTASPDNKNVKT
jgi:hypothetical protein